MGYDSDDGFQILDGRSSAPSVLNEGFYSSPLIKMNLRLSEEVMEGGPYPKRPGQLDCDYYMRTGLCRFGMTCRYNHPTNRKLVVAASRMKGIYPERVGQPECQYYLKTGICRFGATCKFHHPREKAGIAGRVQLNELGYPLRPNEIDCAYYLRTGQCKFGSTCKFHHPEPSNMLVTLQGSPIYPTVQSPSAQNSYPGGLTSWAMPRDSYIPSPRWQGVSSYTPMILSQGLVQVPGWNAYTGQLGSASSPHNQQQTPGSIPLYSNSQQSEMSNAGTPGMYSSYRVGSAPVGLYGSQGDNVFPERPGEPECQFYMKTGDCKFGAVCKFHHPRERKIPIPDCILSPLGLPLRHGEPFCAFYSRYGSCKFGPFCKFDHPTGIFPYAISASTDIPIQNFLGSSSGTGTLTFSSLGRPVEEAKKSTRLSISETRQLSSSDENPEAER